MRQLIVLGLFVLFYPFNSYAASNQLSLSLYDSVYLSEKGIDVIVDLTVIERALAEGANPNWVKSEGKKHTSVLGRYVYLISVSDNSITVEKGIKAIELLFKYNAKLQYCDASILFWPIARGKYEIVKLLLEKGASATFWPKDEIGIDITPIEEATAKGDKKIIDLLISHGARRLKDAEAIQIRFIEVARFGSVDELRNLVEMGAKVNDKNRQERTALICALDDIFYQYGTYLKIMYLLDLGADVNLKGKERSDITTPLHHAVYASNFLFRARKDTSYAERILEELLKRGAFVSALDEDGRTPLHIASKYNHLYAARLLLDSGAKVMQRDKQGKTPLDYAESGEMVKLLKERGAKEY